MGRIVSSLSERRPRCGGDLLRVPSRYPGLSRGTARSLLRVRARCCLPRARNSSRPELSSRRRGMRWSLCTCTGWMTRASTSASHRSEPPNSAIEAGPSRTSMPTTAARSWFTAPRRVRVGVRGRVDSRECRVGDGKKRRGVSPLSLCFNACTFVHKDIS